MPHIKLNEKKIFYSKTEHGIRTRVGLTTGSDIVTDEGDSIKGGNFIAIEKTDYKKLNKRNVEHFWKKVDDAVERHRILKSIGIAGNHILTPLRENRKG